MDLKTRLVLSVEDTADNVREHIAQCRSHQCKHHNDRYRYHDQNERVFDQSLAFNSTDPGT